MDPNAQRSGGRNVPANAYWRRRFFTLVAGLGVVGLLIWACSGIVSGKSGPQATGASRATAAVSACPAADIVLTLLTSKASYGPEDMPAFQVDVVSTDTATCAFDTGPASLRVIVTQGSRLAWNSGVCLQNAASRVTRLRRGVPVEVPVVWNRYLNAGGCSATMLAAPQRTYVAVAQSGGLESPGRSFRLK